MYLNINHKDDYIYVQIYRKLKEQILNNEITYNEKLPSIRALSKDLNVSLNTVKQAYYQLEEEGYIESKQRSGFFCRKIDDLIILDEIEERFEITDESEPEYDFSISGVDIENFPYSTWRRMLKESVVDQDKNLLKKGDFKGYYPLRKAIASYLDNSRGIETKADNIIISSGTESLFNLVKMLLPSDTLYAFENPGYAFGNKFFTYDLANPIPLSLDDEGVNIENVRDLNSCCLFVTPYQQFPMGTVMSIDRRVELLNWASEMKYRVIIEDDYEPEFKLKGYAIPSLKSMDKNDDIIYMGSFSKVIAPALRISYMILPNKLLNIYEQKFSSLGCTVSTYIQKATALFISQGHYEKHLNRMKVIYSKKYELITSLIKNIPDLEIVSKGNALILVIEIKRKINMSDFLDNLNTKSVKLRSLDRFYYRKVKENNRFILGFAGMSKENIIEGMRIIKEVMGVCESWCKTFKEN